MSFKCSKDKIRQELKKAKTYTQSRLVEKCRLDIYVIGYDFMLSLIYNVYPSHLWGIIDFDLLRHIYFLCNIFYKGGKRGQAGIRKIDILHLKAKICTLKSMQECVRKKYIHIQKVICFA